MILKNVCFYNEVFEKEVADIKIENGKKYKRLYNYTTQTWVGDWILMK